MQLPAPIPSITIPRSSSSPPSQCPQCPQCPLPLAPSHCQPSHLTITCQSCHQNLGTPRLQSLDSFGGRKPSVITSYFISFHRDTEPPPPLGRRVGRQASRPRVEGEGEGEGIERSEPSRDVRDCQCELACRLYSYLSTPRFTLSFTKSDLNQHSKKKAQI